MTRQEYLSELKYCLRSLPVEEQEEALEFYRSYFEDACDDEEVMREFGSPENLAQEIISKFASVPELRKSSENKGAEGRFGNYKREEVRSLDISVGVAEVVLAGEGDTFSVEYRNLNPGDIKCGLSPFGTFTVENNRRFPDVSKLFRNENNGVSHARILIKIPADCKLDLLRLHVGAGSFTCKNVSITTSRSYVDVGAGNLELERVKGGSGEFHVGMGHLSYKGSLSGMVKADCGMGQLEMKLSGNKEDYSISAHVGLGSVSLNDTKKDGFGNLECQETKANHFSVNCGLGEVKISIA